MIIWFNTLHFSALGHNEIFAQTRTMSRVVSLSYEFLCPPRWLSWADKHLSSCSAATSEFIRLFGFTSSSLSLQPLIVHPVEEAPGTNEDSMVQPTITDDSSSLLQNVFTSPRQYTFNKQHPRSTSHAQHSGVTKPVVYQTPLESVEEEEKEPGRGGEEEEDEKRRRKRRRGGRGGGGRWKEEEEEEGEEEEKRRRRRVAFKDGSK